MGRFEGRAAVVTGAARGIGRRVALDLAAEGARVLGADVDAPALAALASERAGLRRAAEDAPPPRPWLPAFGGGSVAVIAEVKRRSPSAGAIAAGLAPAAHARAYVAGGAAAISVLTDGPHFGGSLADLAAVHQAVPVPLLRKDFIIDPVQLYEARLHGASAVLLILRALDPAALADLAVEARALGLARVVEAHAAVELERALRVEPEAVGVNARDLETLRVDVRMIAATNKDLNSLIKAGSFREDLYYRLNVINVAIPPLRERKEDVVELSQHFLKKYAKKLSKSITEFTSEALDLLTGYNWPGNVRELENVVERAVLLAEDGVVRGHHLPPTLQTAQASRTGLAGGLRGALDSMEKEYIIEALKSAHGNAAAAAPRGDRPGFLADDTRVEDAAFPATIRAAFAATPEAPLVAFLIPDQARRPGLSAGRVRSGRSTSRARS